MNWCIPFKGTLTEASITTPQLLSFVPSRNCFACKFHTPLRGRPEILQYCTTCAGDILGQIDGVDHLHSGHES